VRVRALAGVLIFVLAGACSDGTEPLRCEPSRGGTSEECAAIGGTYFAEPPQCACPTKDARKPCTATEQCEERCVSDATNCDNLTEGYCYEYRFVSICACTLVEDQPSRAFCGPKGLLYVKD
jgi:hypothetical protein